MTIKGVDTTDHTLTGATLAANGYAFVCRYFSNHVNRDWKDIHADEVAEKTAAGVRIVSNWELMADPPNSRATGRSHAKDFLAEQDMLPGHVDWNPCYYSLDVRSPSAGSWDEYAKGWADVLTPERCGAYAEGLVLKHLLAIGVIKWTWKSMSTSFPDATGYTLNMRQTGSGHVAGHSVDFDTALTANYGGWFANEPDPSKPKPPEVIDMLATDLLAIDPAVFNGAKQATVGQLIVDAATFAKVARDNTDTLEAKVAALATAVAKLPTTALPSAPIDYAALAKAVNDDAAKRLEA